MALSTDTDHVHLGRAIDLADRGLGRVNPNPVVGAVVARDDRVLGEGWHAEFGGPHAEVNAIAACGDAELQGATLYVSLEPCCHEGKTLPCIDARVRRTPAAISGKNGSTESAVIILSRPNSVANHGIPAMM